MSTARTVLLQLQKLLDDANEATKCQDVTLTDAVSHLIDNYGAETIQSITNNGYGTHKVVTLCNACGDIKEATVDCTDANEDDFCDICGGLMIEGKIYTIATADDLINFAGHVNNGASNLNAIVTSDIDMSDVKWIDNLSSHAIGTPEAPYSGTFDGQGHTISGLNIAFVNKFEVLGGSTTQDDFYRDFRLGLFGTTENATIQNISVDGKIVLSGRATNNNQPGSSKIGGLIGMATDTIITNCINKIAITGVANTVTGAFANIGGLVGLSNNLIMDKCGNEADLIVMGADMGGLIGYADGISKITNSYNTGAVDGCLRIGGIVGTIVSSNDENNKTVINNCYNSGRFDNHIVDNLNDANPVYTRDTNAGGIAGRCLSEDTSIVSYLDLINCYVNGNTTAPNPDGLYTALHRYKNGEIITKYENNWYLEGEAYAASSGTATSISELDMATIAFAEQMGDAYVLLNGGTSPVLEWQCDHDVGTVYIPNEDNTHSITDKCVNCSFVKEIHAESVTCVDVDNDGLCDSCHWEIKNMYDGEDYTEELNAIDNYHFIASSGKLICQSYPYMNECAALAKMGGTTSDEQISSKRVLPIAIPKQATKVVVTLADGETQSVEILLLSGSNPKNAVTDSLKVTLDLDENKKAVQEFNAGYYQYVVFNVIGPYTSSLWPSKIKNNTTIRFE